MTDQLNMMETGTMPTTDRYIVQSAYRNAAGDWYGSTDPDPDDQWFFVRDTAEDASDWTDDDIAPGPYREDVEATCKLLNRLARAAQPNTKEPTMAERFMREQTAQATADRAAKGRKVSATPKRHKLSRAEKKRRKRDRTRASA